MENAETGLELKIQFMNLIKNHLRCKFRINQYELLNFSIYDLPHPYVWWFVVAVLWEKSRLPKTACLLNITP